MNKKQAFAVAQAALTQYAIEWSGLEYLGTSENSTFKVETAADRAFLLRIHHGYDATPGAESGDWRGPAAIRSELLWLAALSQGTDLTVPRPLQNEAGAWVTSVELPKKKRPYHCSLLHWMEGEHLEDEPSAAHVTQLGRLMAQMHQFAAPWQPPKKFARPTHDASKFQHALPKLERLVQADVITPQAYDVCVTVAERVSAVIAALPRKSDSWGMIHADLHQGNYIVADEIICPIDFSLCGYGFYLYDIGQTLGDLAASLRQPFLTSYADIRSLPQDAIPTIEAFFNAATLENYAFLSANKAEHQLLARAIPFVVEHHFTPFLNGQPFLFDA